MIDEKNTLVDLKRAFIKNENIELALQKHELQIKDEFMQFCQQHIRIFTPKFTFNVISINVILGYFLRCIILIV